MKASAKENSVFHHTYSTTDNKRCTEEKKWNVTRLLFFFVLPQQQQHCLWLNSNAWEPRRRWGTAKHIGLDVNVRFLPLVLQTQSVQSLILLLELLELKRKGKSQKWGVGITGLLLRSTVTSECIVTSVAEDRFYPGFSVHTLVVTQCVLGLLL